jgi:peptidoglycan/LPS O-acetylase OafA/YrhL
VPATEERPGDRLAALDWLRAAATVAVISIHVTLGGWDPDHAAAWEALSPASRFANALANSLSRFAVASFVAASFFLLARSLAARPEPYGAVVRKRFARIAPAYLFWSAVFMVVQGLRVAAGKHSLAAGFGWAKEAPPWAYALLAGAPPNMYHLWFVPMLLALTLAFPLARGLARGPAAIAAAAGFLALADWLNAHQPAVVAASPWGGFWWPGTRVVTYAAFATLGWAAAQAVARGPSLAARRALVLLGALAIAFALVVFVGEARAKAAASGAVADGPLTYWALYAYPAGLFGIVIFAGLGSRRAPPRAVARLAELSFGVYLAHPLALMLFDPLEGRGLRFGGRGLFVAKIAIVLALAWALTAAMARSPRLRRFVK